MKKLFFICALFIFFSCSSDCVTCKVATPDMILEEEYCNDETNYTDQNGEIITFEEFILFLENRGYECN